MSGEEKLADSLRALVAPIGGIRKEHEAKVDALLRLMTELHNMTPRPLTKDDPRISGEAPTRKDAEWRADGFSYVGPEWKVDARAEAMRLMREWLVENGL
jgi:hypothetical protein